MKFIAFIVVALFCAIPLLAQQPSISYLMCDEAKSQLQIHGTFGTDSGSVSIEDTTLGIVSWSDSLIIASLPDSGKGAGGNVVVQTVKGVSNKRVLSIFIASLNYADEFYQGAGRWLGPVWSLNLNWRIDLGKDYLLSSNIFFEVSKISSGVYEDGPILPWRDSSLSFKDSSVIAKGFIDRKNSKIYLTKIFIGWRGSYPSQDTFVIFQHSPVQYDSTGKSYGKFDTGMINGSEKWGSNMNAYVLYPPGPKSIVSQPKQSNTDQINILTNDHSITLQSAGSLGATTASLYTIDGRLLKRVKLDISAAGIYTLDESDVHTYFALLVLQTERGVITRKILF